MALAISGCAAFTRTTDSAATAPTTAAKPALAQDTKKPAESRADSPTSEMFSGVSNAVRGITGAKKIATAKDQDTARQLYATADQLFREAGAADGSARKAKFKEAAEQYSAAAKSWPNSALEEDALFASADSYYFAEHYPQANDGFERLLKRYPNTRHLDATEARRYRLAQWWLEQADKDPEAFYEFNLTDKQRPTRDTFGNAVRVFDRIRVEDPTGKLADDATLAAGNAFFRKKKFEKADTFYEDLRKTFPSSEHQFQAHFLGLKSKMASYRGPEYDGSALDESEKLILQMKRQFPREYEREREYLNRAFAEVRYLKAQREMQLAKYYDRRGEYGAARDYYTNVNKTYGDTPLAAEAAKRLAEIGEKPAVPAQHMEWLVNLFPEPEGRKGLIATKPGETQQR